MCWNFICQIVSHMWHLPYFDSNKFRQNGDWKCLYHTMSTLRWFIYFLLFIYLIFNLLTLQCLVYPCHFCDGIRLVHACMLSQLSFSIMFMLSQLACYHSYHFQSCSCYHSMHVITVIIFNHVHVITTCMLSQFSFSIMFMLSQHAWRGIFWLFE